MSPACAQQKNPVYRAVLETLLTIKLLYSIKESLKPQKIMLQHVSTDGHSVRVRSFTRTFQILILRDCC